MRTLKGTISTTDPTGTAPASAKAFLVTSRKTYALAAAGRGRRWLDVPQYKDHAVRVRGAIRNGAVEASELSLEPIVERKGAATDLTIVSAGRNARTRISTGSQLRIDGRLPDAQSGLYRDGCRYVLVGFDGFIELPRRAKVQMLTGVTDPGQAARDLLGGTPAARQIGMLASGRRVVKPADLLPLFEWATQLTNRDFFLGAFPAQDPFVQEYLTRREEARRFNSWCAAMAAAPVEIMEGTGAERAGRHLNDSIANSPKILAPRKEEMYKAGRRLIATPPDRLADIEQAFQARQVRRGSVLKGVREEIAQKSREVERQIDEEVNDKNWPGDAEDFAIGAVVGILIGGLVGVVAGPYLGVLAGENAAKVTFAAFDLHDQVFPYGPLKRLANGALIHEIRYEERPFDVKVLDDRLRIAAVPGWQQRPTVAPLRVPGDQELAPFENGLPFAATNLFTIAATPEVDAYVAPDGGRVYFSTRLTGNPLLDAERTTSLPLARARLDDLEGCLEGVVERLESIVDQPDASAQPFAFVHRASPDRTAKRLERDLPRPEARRSSADLTTAARAAGEAAAANRPEFVDFGLKEAAQTAVEAIRYDPNNLAAYALAALYHARRRQPQPATDIFMTLALKLRLAQRLMASATGPDGPFLAKVVRDVFEKLPFGGLESVVRNAAGHLKLSRILDHVVPTFPQPGVPQTKR